MQVFAHLVETYCGDRTSGVLPAFMGGVEYPPSWWLPVAITIAALGLILIVAAAALREADGSRGCLALCGCPGPEGLGCRCSSKDPSATEKAAEADGVAPRVDGAEPTPKAPQQLGASRQAQPASQAEGRP